MGWRQTAIIANLVVIEGPGSGLFLYRGTPAFGNPPILYASSASTDPVGNPITPNTLSAATLRLIIGAITAQAATFNPGPLLLYGNPNVSVQVFSSTGTFTPAGNGTVSCAFYGQGGAGSAGGLGGGGGECATDSDTVTASTPYTITIDATSTRATFNTKTITAHAGSSGAAGGLPGSGSTNAGHFNGGFGAIVPTGVGDGGGGAGPGSAGGSASATHAGSGGAGFNLFPAGGIGGSGSSGPGASPGGGGASPAGAGGGGLAVIIFTQTGGAQTLLDSVAQSVGTDPVTGATYQRGIVNYGPFSTNAALDQGHIYLATASTVAQILQTSTGGQISIANNQALTTNISGMQPADFTATTVTATGNNVIGKSWSIPTNDATYAGATYVFDLLLNGTQGSTAQSLTVGWQLDGVSAATITLPSSFAGISAAFLLTGKLTVYIDTTGVSGSYFYKFEVTSGAAGGTTTPAVAAQTGAATTINTTTSHTVQFEAGWGSVTGAPTLTSRVTTMRRLA